MKKRSFFLLEPEEDDDDDQGRAVLIPDGPGRPPRTFFASAPHTPALRTPSALLAEPRAPRRQ